jgi:hypothetical protein
MLFRRPHISERKVIAFGTKYEMFKLSCSCGWCVQDYDAREVERVWMQHLEQYRASNEAQMREVAEEFYRVFGNRSTEKVRA